MNAAQTGHITDTTFERHFTLTEIAAAWNISHETARRIFADEPGVICIRNVGPSGKPAARKKPMQPRQYATYRIPESVARRVHKRMFNG